MSVWPTETDIAVTAALAECSGSYELLIDGHKKRIRELEAENLNNKLVLAAIAELPGKWRKWWKWADEGSVIYRQSQAAEKCADELENLLPPQEKGDA